MSDISNLNAIPFIIWTLQRTGGTNLAHRLFERSPLPSAQHEPFNRDRVYDYVTKSWLQNHDAVVLKTSVAKIASTKYSMKHCVETVPLRISEELARASTAAGYRHVFLYRQNPLYRLLSLHFARLTDIWGPGVSETTTFSEAIFDRELPVDELVQREQRCSSRLQDIWALLNSLGAHPVAVSFEELYSADDPAPAKQKLRRLLQYLHLSRGEEADEQWISAVLKKGDQGTRSKYAKFKSIDELEKKLRDIDLFDPKRSRLGVIVEDLGTGNTDIRYALIDTKPATIAEGDTFDLEGVVVLSASAPSDARLTLRSGHQLRDVRWGIRSPRMSQQFPEGANSKFARFRIENLVATPGGVHELALSHPLDGPKELFRITTDYWRE